MKTTLKVSVACGLTALLMGMNAQAEVIFGADGEFDITTQTSDKLSHGGQVKLTVSSEQKGDNYFVKGVAQPLFGFATGNNNISYDDVFLQFGQAAWDVKAGKFEGFDLMPLGKDTIIAHAAGAASTYGAGAARGRFSDALHTAIHINTIEGVQLELGTALRNDDKGDSKFMAVRPAIIYSAGPATIRAGFESMKTTTTKTANGKKTTANSTDKGFGVSAGYTVGAGIINAGVARKTPAGTKAEKITTMNLNYTQGPWGVGLVNSKEGKAKLNTVYGAYTMPLLGSDKASITFAASTSKGKNSAGKSVDTENAARVRLNYAF